MVVLGAGSWGTALALQLARSGAPVILWDHDAAQVARLRTERENKRYLPGVTLPDNIRLEADLATALRAARDVLVVVPSHAFRSVLQTVRPLLPADHRVCWATKGLEAGSGRLLHEVAEEVLGRAVPLAVISGPTFAREVAEGLPTAVTVAARDQAFAREIAQRLHT